LNPPFISVIITAFNRKQFLSSALDSIASQTLERSKYEILVVKNFLDDTIDLKLESLGAKTFLMGNENMGTYLATAVENSLGSILVFLDDDDEFENNRLEIIYDLFSKIEEIGYYHNDRVAIDASGKVLSESLDFRPAETRNVQRMGSFLVKNSPLSKSDADKLYLVQAFNYKSCLAIRKSKLIPFLPHFKLINRAPDYFMFYSALASGCALAIDSRKLTRYRLHGSNISLFRNKLHSNKLDAIYMNHVREGMKTLKVILQMINQTNAPPLVRKMVLHDFRTLKVDLDAIDSRSSRSVRLVDLAKYLRVGFRSTFYYQNMVLLQSLISVFFPKFSRRWFVLRKLYRQ
jgi:glycosyltransferase involved in cell wall biosynthesis